MNKKMSKAIEKNEYKVTIKHLYDISIYIGSLLYRQK